MCVVVALPLHGESLTDDLPKSYRYAAKEPHRAFSGELVLARMTKILLTAFQPFGDWPENSSWLTLVEYLQNLAALPEITTRRYPVDFVAVRGMLEEDLQENYDFAIHLGQATGATQIALEKVAINFGREADQPGSEHCSLEAEGPVAFQSDLPLAEWAASLRSLGIPARVSCHAGTYLCNATLYWSCYLTRMLALTTRSTFVHLPLACEQVARRGTPDASLSRQVMASAVGHIVEQLEKLS